MPINLSAPPSTELKPRIVVFGVGGAGGNAVNNMIDAGLEGVEFVVANTDAQQLQFAKTDRRIQLGVTVTQGLGAGAHPETGMNAAEESAPEIAEHLEGAHMVFITAGMGGGTGTGAAPVIAKAARERGILTVGVVTKPFTFEGRQRMRMADAGVSELTRYVDTLIVIPNQNLFRIANERTTFAEAFGMADQVLHSGVRSITDLMVLPGLINLDFADVRAVMTEMGKAMMGTGESDGEDRALMAAQNAIQNPLLDEVSLKGARAVLINVTGGLDMTLLEVDEAANAISSEVDPDANIIFGAAFDPSLQGRIRVSVVATGMDSVARVAEPPQPIAEAPTRIAPITRPQTAAPQAAVPRTAAAAASVAAATAPALEPAAAYEEAPLVASERKVIVDEAAEGGELFPHGSRLHASSQGPRSYTRPGQPPLPDPRAIPETARKGGLFSLFGGGKPQTRYEPSLAEPSPLSRPATVTPAAPLAPAPRAAAHAGGAAAAPALEPETLEAADDLDIPSFLRRLAN